MYQKIHVKNRLSLVTKKDEGMLVKPGLCNRFRYEGINRKKPGSFALIAWHRYGEKENETK